jgi:antitoxin component YwqK of YwqJK toxin-antitoxin module
LIVTLALLVDMRRLFFFVFGVCCLGSLYAQEGESIEELFKVKYETPLTIDMDEQSKLEDEYAPDQKKKEKKKNPKIYYGIKTKRGFAKQGFGTRTTIELFFYLKDKDFEGPTEYARDFYWYDFKKKKIVNSLRVDRDNAGVLHGHYTKTLGEQLIEEGYFYKGIKHARWVRYNRNDILQEKEIYWKGWPKESLLSYYDYERENLREMIPVHFGEREGEYYVFHANGKLAVVGHYKFDQPVGVWREYYDNERVKREVTYPLEPFDKNGYPVISKEWDREGKIIYDRKKYEASAN